MRVAVEKLPGVTGAEVSLEQGQVVIGFEPENEVTINDVRRAIGDQGFAPRDADVLIAGRLEQRGEGLVLRVPGSDLPYPVAARGEMLARLRQAVGEDALVSGGIPRTDDAEASATIQVTALTDP